MLHTSYQLLLILFSLVAGTVDAIAGGGGLISLPMLLSVGVPPHIALGTNKLQVPLILLLLPAVIIMQVYLISTQYIKD